MWIKLSGPAKVGDYVRPRNEGRDPRSLYPEPTLITRIQGECLLTKDGPTSLFPWNVWRGEGVPPDYVEPRP